MNRFYVPRFSNRQYARQENVEYEHFVPFVVYTQLLANYFVCEREPKNAVGTYCGSRQTIYRTPSGRLSHFCLGYRRGRLARNN